MDNFEVAAPSLGVSEDDILKYLLSDQDNSSPDATPPLLEESASDASPSHWSQQSSQDFSIPMDDSTFVYPATNDILFPLNMSASSLPMIDSPISPVTPPQQQILATPIVTPSANAVPSNAKKIRSKKRPATEIDVPSPEEEVVVLPRDTLLQISSQKMDKYVETLQSKRNLSLDEQKELKRQKRLIKNRESAQLSRERKRAYIDELEAKIALLNSEITSLKEENSSLKQSLSQYQSNVDIKPVTTQQNQIATKMNGLLSINGGARPGTAAKAGVCLLIVLFSFGLFMNGNNRESGLQLRTMSPPALSDMKMNFESAALPNMHITGHKRSIMESPEVIDEDELTIYNSAIPTAVPTVAPTSIRSTQRISVTDDSEEAPVVPTHTVTTTTTTSPVHVRHIRPMEVQPGGIFKVSYSPEPAEFITEKEHVHDGSTPNNTYMLFLDPRPDLIEEADMDNNNEVARATQSHLQVASSRPRPTVLPPMIISLVIPEHIANGSNPLLLPDGISYADSLMEITCQVVDVHITTSQRH